MEYWIQRIGDFPYLNTPTLQCSSTPIIEGLKKAPFDSNRRFIIQEQYYKDCKRR
jgi:hypothetical protein